MLRIVRLGRPGLEVESLDVPDGACVAVTGASGAGKTLLLRAVADLDPNEGEVEAAGMIRERTPAPLWRRRVAYVAAESAWWAETVGEHFADPDAARPLIEALLLPAESLDWAVARLSTGEKQRLALARSLASRPPVMLLDEPTAALDAEATAAVERVLRARLDEGASILMVTHDPAQALRLAGSTLRIEHGRIAGVVP